MKREGRRRLSVAHLLVALGGLFAVQPVVDQFSYGDLIESFAFTGVLLAGVSAVGNRRRTHAIAAMLVAPALLTRWIDHFWPGFLPTEVCQFAAILFVAYVGWHLLRFVIVAPQVNAEVLCAAISVLLLTAIIWSMFYTLLGKWDPHAFQLPTTAGEGARLDGFLAVYFSLQVITANSFGDIVPASNIARVLTLAEALVGMFYLAIFISRLVGAYTSEPAAAVPPGEERAGESDP